GDRFGRREGEERVGGGPRSHRTEGQGCSQRRRQPEEPHRFPPFALPLHWPLSLVVKIAPRLFWASALTEARGGRWQISGEFLSGGGGPASRVIVKRSIGASGSSSKKARIPCFAGSIRPSTTIRIAPE